MLRGFLSEHQLFKHFDHIVSRKACAAVQIRVWSKTLSGKYIKSVFCYFVDTFALSSCACFGTVLQHRELHPAVVSLFLPSLHAMFLYFLPPVELNRLNFVVSWWSAVRLTLELRWFAREANVAPSLLRRYFKCKTAEDIWNALNPG